MSSEDQKQSLLELTAQIVSAHVAKNQIAPAGLTALIEQVYTALKSAGNDPAPAPVEKQVPFVPPKRSVFPDYIICLEDGRRLKTLKRHLRSTFGLSPEQYREKWGLAPDYPMVAPNYAEHRSRLAKQLGLGRKPPGEDEAEAETPEPAPAPPRAASARPAAAEPAPEPREPPPARRRGEPTAASVFASFPKQAEATPPAESGTEPAKKKRGRKPFSRQLARSMPR
jgi:predicted transcriptional regulator